MYLRTRVWVIVLLALNSAAYAAMADLGGMAAENVRYAALLSTVCVLAVGVCDFLLRRCDLDTILRPAVRKFAPQFIRRHLTLRYEPVGKTVLTDEKWLGFVIEQVLSNAVKYTPEGGTVTVSCTDAPALLISDTGIGVEPEDLPRVFEQGFTGYNGRADKKATGLGLYLCRRVCRKLGHTIAMDSRVGEGTTVTIGLARTEREHE